MPYTPLTHTGQVLLRFMQSSQAGSLLLVVCTAVALLIVNAPPGPAYLSFWHQVHGGLSLELWVNDALMAVFFLHIGLELQRELYAGQLASRDTALLPVVAAVGGMLVPAAIHYAFNAGTPTVHGFGIPMATDIAFSLGVLALLGKRIPLALRVFIVAFAVIDDLGAIIVIALFYSGHLALPWLGAAVALWLALFALHRIAGVRALTPYLLLGAVLWFFVLKSGVHATLAGVALAFTIPFRKAETESPAERLEHALSRPVAFLVLPLFALANAGVVLDLGTFIDPSDMNRAGIFLGLVVGKPLGVLLGCAFAVRVLGLKLPPDLTRVNLLGAGMLGGIGFTMSIFIANLAFDGQALTINSSKLSIISASLTSAVLGWGWLMFWSRRT